jgi:uncharacterized membrane protein
MPVKPKGPKPEAPIPETPAPDRPVFPDHLAGSIEAMSAFHLAHHRGASGLQRGMDRLTAAVGAPWALVLIVAALAVWGVQIVALSPRGELQHGIAWLSLTASCAALLVSVLILITQRREDILAERRDQLILELAILSDRKGAKLIALIEELRRDVPNVSDRIDPESEGMATPTDLVEVIAAIDQGAAET